ncbi:MAG: response regulator [Labilithrix sp.]|nr:response regulator [Labilithrix sp.]
MAPSRPPLPGIQILDELGRGAHSVVYRGVQDGTPCAVKLPSVKARWTRWIYREAVALARVKHRALPAVLEVGDVDGLPYLVMELVRGETLASRMQTERLEESVCVALLNELLDALSAVHDAGLVHRDVKPRNIIVESETNALKLVDFGFATPIERLGREDAAGTAAYAAPEQLVMPGRVDGRTDLFAVGRVVLECLTGRPLSTQVGYGPLGAAARLELISAAVSVGLAEIVAGLLQHDPEDRYADARAVKADLQRMARGEPLLGPEGSEVDRRAIPLVARDGELEQIVEFVGGGRAGPRAARGDSDVLPRGRGVVVVAGKRGAGKTRLLSSVAGRVRELGHVIEVKCVRDDAPLSSLRRILEAHVGSTRPRRRQAAADDDFLASLGALARVATLIAPSLDSTNATSVSGQSVPPSNAAAETLSEGAAEILLRLAAKRPLYLFIDDIQWMDPASADALMRVAHRLVEASVVLVLGSRSAGVEALAERFAAAQPKSSLVVELGALTEAQVGAIVAAHLGESTVSEALVRRVHAMADGTVLGVLEVLGAFLDAGAVRPHSRAWLFDVARADRVVLPSGALALLGRRLGELPVATQRVLEAAAVIGTAFEDELLGRVVELPLDDLGFGMAAARRAGLVEPEGDGTHRFVHDSLREMLLEGIEGPTLKRLHQRVAEALASERSSSVDALCAIALHFVNGEIEKDPSRALDACRAAARAALERFSNETALEYLEHARKAAARAGRRLESQHHRAVGEAQLRLGMLDESLAAFELALECSAEPKVRASLLGRLAWVHQTRAEPERASELLERAFLALGVRMPVGTVGSAARTALGVAGAKARRRLNRSDSGPARDEIELLSGLHYQNARLGLEYGEPLRFVQSSVEALELSKQGTSARATARARALHGVVMTTMRLRDAGARDFARAEALASEQDDPVTTVFCLQLRSVAAIFAGELDLAMDLARECVDIFGPWLELSEYCYHIANVELIQASRGRSLEAWSWLERALDRLRRSNTRPAVAEYLIHRARATMAALGHEPNNDWLAQQFAAVSPTKSAQGFHRLLSWGPRARWYVERGDLGEEFEALVNAFEAEGHEPRSVHPVVSEFYVALAHARLHQAFRAGALERDRSVAALRRATADLALVAKLPVLRAHLLLAEGCIAWFEGNERKANKALGEAEALADEQSCPWVLYGVARARAHKLRAEGRGDAARDQARIAATLATEHGAVHRARWIREEFSLPAPVQDVTSVERSTSSRRSSRTNRQLAALIQVAQAPRRDLKAEQQAGRILDELMSSISAARAAIWFQPEPNASGTAVFRHRGSDLSVSVGADSPRGALLRLVHKSGEAWPPIDGGNRAVAVGEHAFDPTRVIAVPLTLYEKPVGALCIERLDDDPPFALDDRSLLVLLSHQVPITLEIARLLFEREQLHTSLQQAKKMEAMGQLAGGLAHDFNNMLAAMKVALSAARERASLDAELTIELDIISQATTRAAQLTSQLLSFSRHQPVPVAVHDVNQLISTLEPMLRRVVGSKVVVSTDLSPAVDAVEVDQGSFDQALVNLLINARDAMPSGGTLKITTRNVVLGETVAQRNSLPPGPYVEVEVADTGEGMSAETVSRIFEPFFTTKPSGSGSGLGLAMVYAFARNCGGSIDVSSEVGQGTQFRLYLKRIERKRTSRPVRPLTASVTPPTVIKHEGPDTILVVDDDDLVRRSIAKILERHGYRVVAANGSTEALNVAREEGARIGLVILDVLMPGVTGPELGRRLYDLNLSAKLLFVSGFSPESIPLEEAHVAAEMLLQKPFSQTALLERVRQLMHH